MATQMKCLVIWFKDRYSAQKEYDDAQRGIQMENVALQARALDLEKKNVALQARVLDLEEKVDKEVRENRQAALCDICRKALNSQLYFRH